MDKHIELYDKETAPKGIKVGMDYEADPIWVSSSEFPEDSLPCENKGLELFPFPPALKHLLYCYQEAWEAAHSSEIIPLGDLSDEYESNPTMLTAINSSLAALGSACEDMLEVWIHENNWDTKLYRQSSFL